MWHRGRRGEPLVAVGDSTSAHPVPEICSGRFRLEDRILGSHADGLWRAFDERLGRVVSVRLVHPTSPQIDELRSAVCAAAKVVDPRVARILDVLDSDGTLVIVTEWIDGTPLEQVLRHEMSVERSVQISRDVAATIAAVHAAGNTHGRLRPACVMITPDNEVRIRGIGIDATVWGVVPGPDAVAADISGIGAILAACLTGRWPGEAPTELTRSPTLGGRLAKPSQLRADLPSDLDDIFIRAMAAAPSAATRRSRRPFGSAQQVYSELAHVADQSGPIVLPGAPVALPKARREPVSSATFMKRSVLLAVLAAVAICGLLVSARIFIDDPAKSAAVAVAGNLAEGPTGTSAATNGNDAPRIALLPPAAPNAPTEKKLPILRAFEVRNGAISSGASFAKRAIDNDAGTSWPSGIYPEDGIPLSNASGVVVDLGSPRPTRAIGLGLVGNNSDVTVSVSNFLHPALKGFRTVSEVSSAPGLMTLRQPRPILARYIYIALTSVPATGKEYRGGISSVHVFGS